MAQKHVLKKEKLKENLKEFRKGSCNQYDMSLTEAINKSIDKAYELGKKASRAYLNNL